MALAQQPRGTLGSPPPSALGAAAAPSSAGAALGLQQQAVQLQLDALLARLATAELQASCLAGRTLQPAASKAGASGLLLLGGTADGPLHTRAQQGVRVIGAAWQLCLHAHRRA